MRRVHLTMSTAIILALAVLSAGVTAQSPATGAGAASPARNRIWRDPGPMAALDLRYGAGGKAHAPNPAGGFTFVSEDARATSPKFVVVDRAGIEWKVKLGPESQAETAATRFLWAAGYFVDEDYYVAELTVRGLPALERGQDLVSAGGVVRGARLERKRTSAEKVGDWDWFDNPFVGKREMNGLRVMMALLNNWDLKQDNNAIYEEGGERRYLVSDAGATFGKTGDKATRSKGVPKHYAGSTFIAKSTPATVDLVLHSRPVFLSVFAVSNYLERTGMEKITKDIPRADARWLGRRLSMLSTRQIRDAFRAAGYDDGDIDILATIIAQRIATLKAL